MKKEDLKQYIREQLKTRLSEEPATLGLRTRELQGGGNKIHQTMVQIDSAMNTLYQLIHGYKNTIGVDDSRQVLRLLDQAEEARAAAGRVLWKHLPNIKNEALVGKIPGGVTIKHARTEEEAAELEKDGFIRVDKRKPSFNYKDEKGSYIPMMKRGTA